VDTVFARGRKPSPARGRKKDPRTRVEKELTRIFNYNNNGENEEIQGKRKLSSQHEELA